MNPCSADQGAGDFYEGSVALDQALADRFAFVIQVPDWEDLEAADRELIADSIELMITAHAFDAMVLLTNCDKVTPGMLMAASARSSRWPAPSSNSNTGC